MLRWLVGKKVRQVDRVNTEDGQPTETYQRDHSEIWSNSRSHLKTSTVERNENRSAKAIAGLTCAILASVIIPQKPAMFWASNALEVQEVFFCASIAGVRFPPAKCASTLELTMRG